MSDQNARTAFRKKMLDVYTGGVLTQLMDVGHRTGLFDSSASGAFTPEDLADSTGLDVRYVKEWLCAMATGGIYEYDEETNTFALPEAHASSLTGNQSSNLAPMGRLIDNLVVQIPELVERFRRGGGIPYSSYQPHFTDDLDDLWRRIYDEHLIDGFIGMVGGLDDSLQQGLRVLDVGCGTGHAINLMAREYPKSEFIGYDISVRGIERAKNEAADWGLTNASFEVLDVVRLPRSNPFDLVMAVDTIHDVGAPERVLSAICEVLKPDGVFLMVEFAFQSDVAGNLGNPFAPMYYGISLLHCMQVSLAAGGSGLGTVWGEESARNMLTAAGFRDVRITDTPRPQNCMYVCRK